MADRTLAFRRPNPMAWLRNMSENQLFIGINAGAPTNGTSGTFAGVAGPGSLLIDIVNTKLYINTNTLASPTWTVVGTQS